MQHNPPFQLYWKLFSNMLTSCPDDTVSASSNMDMEDRVSHLEQRLQLQEDEIQLLKAALADALRRLGNCEEQNLGATGTAPASHHCRLLL
uniref:Uncharacterized protein n=1 Tax=Monopterus albus TaxID=43700 RepID=A0A3Q3JDF3_MONAL